MDCACIPLEPVPTDTAGAAKARRFNSAVLAVQAISSGAATGVSLFTLANQLWTFVDTGAVPAPPPGT